MERKKHERHGMSYVPEYRVWVDMRHRCYRTTNKYFKDYGERGITVCERWFESFAAFYADMGPRPEGLTLERNNNDGNYEPSNCRWATQQEQRANRRLRHDNRTGVAGVRWEEHLNTYRVTIKRQGVQRHLGYTKDFYKACCLRKSAESKSVKEI